MKSALIEPLEARIAPATIAIAPASVLEGDLNTTTKLIFTVTLSEASQEQITVDFATEDGSATTPEGDTVDYASKMGTITFAPGETTKTIEVTVFGDDAGEADETMFVRLSNPTGGATIGTDVATGTILNDGVHLVGVTSFLEGDDSHFITYTILRETLNATGDLTVKIKTIDGTATVADNDYTAADASVVLGTGQPTTTFTIEIKGDKKGEADETFQIALSDENDVLFGTPTTITILNDGLHIVTPDAIAEGDTGLKGLEFKVIRETVDLGPATVRYTTVDGTATVSGKDYQQASGTLNFDQDETEKTITVNIIGDLTAEDHETFLVKLFDAVGTTIKQGEATGTILNDAKVKVTPVSSLEGDGIDTNGNNQLDDDEYRYLDFVVTLVEGHGQVTVDYSTQDGSVEGFKAVSGSDYEATSGTLIFQDGETSKTVRVKIIGDLVGENDEKLLLNLFNPSPGAIIETASAEGTILNDVKFSFSPGLGQGSTSDPFKEGDVGLSYMDFVIQASEAAPSGSKVNYATSNISPASGISSANIALAGEDYVATSGTLTFYGEGSNILTQTVKVPIKGDYKFESNERFLMSLSSAGTSHAALPSSLEATITSDDELIISDVQIIEGNSGVKKAVFTVTLKDAVPNGKQFRVHYTTVDGTATGISAAGAGVGDYKTTSGTLKIAAGERTGTIEVEVFGDLDYEALSESFKVSLDNARLLGSSVPDDKEDGHQDLEIGVREGTATIVDSADAPPSISISDSRFLEGSGGGKKQVQFTLTLSVPSYHDVKVKLSSILGTGAGAAGPNDFTPFEDMEVIIPAGQTTATFSVEVEQDDIDELDETFSVKIKDAITVPPQGSSVPAVALTKARDTAIGTIVNDEVFVTVNPVTITEGNSGTKEMIFLVTLSAAAAHDVTVHYTLEDLTALLGQDYVDGSATPGTVVIKAGTTQAEIKILVTGDTVNEGGLQTEPNTNTEQFKLKLTSATNAKLGADGTAPLTVIGTIVDDDPFPTVEIVNEMPNGQIIEGGKAVFKVKLDRPSDHDIEIPYTIENGTAVGGSDFTVGTNLKVVIRAGETEAIITVDTTDDALIEANETFSVKLGTIGEKDAVLKTSSSGQVSATIKDNEVRPALSIGNVVIVEGGPGAGKKAVFTVKLSAVSTENVQVNYHTIDGTAVSFGADADFTATNGTLTIEAGQTEATFEVPIIGDSIVENDETFFVRLTNPSGATIAIDQAMGTIATDETQFRVLFKNADGSFSETLQVNEGDKGTSQQIEFKIVREGDLTKDSSVRFTTVGAGNGAGDLFRDASSGVRADFGYRSEVVYFKNGRTESDTYKITINGDDYYEGTEEFVVRLTETLNGSPAETNPKMGTVQILDNEAVPTITFEKSLVEVKEGGKIQQADKTYLPQQTAMTFRIRLSHVDETGTVSMQVLAEALEAAGLTKAMSSGDKQDYTLPTNVNSISFAPGDTEKTYTITVLGDWRDEDDESIRVTLSGLQGGSAKFSDGTDVAPVSISSIGKILDDDAPVLVYLSDLAKQQVDSSGNEVRDSKGNLVYTGTTYAETDGNGTGKFFLVSLVGETDKVVTVKYYTVNGTAVAGEDFIGTSEDDAITITFNPSASNSTAPIIQKIYIPTINDDVVEGNEDFQVRLKGLTNSTAGDDLRGHGTIEDNDTPIASIEDLEIVETGSASGLVKAKFIVRLAAPAERDVVVNFATEDGTAKASGAFADYIAKQGSVTFKPGEVSKEIEIEIIDDNYLEGHAIKNSNNEWELVQNESFKVKLSGTGVTFARATATGTILNGPEDTVTGIGVSDVQLAEDQTEVVNGQVANLPARFAVELSIPALTDTTVKASTRSGTATKGVDFEDKSAAVTISAGATTATFAVDVFNDQQFENTEYFFADVSNTPAGVQVAKSGRATIYNDDIRQIDARTVQWIDVDGDLVTLKVSKGTLDRNNFIWLQSSPNVTYISPVGGLVLQGLDFSVGNEFQNANITITAERQPGFNGDPNGVLGDGRVNIGYIKAGDLDPAGVSSYGVDLGTVKVDGDLGFINAGDRYLDTPAIRKLQVFSMGVHAEEMGLIARDSEGNVTGASIQSILQGPVGTIDVRTDFSSSIRVTGGQFADIQSIKIGGALRGTEINQSATLIFSGTLQKATIGEIIGGTGSLSGRIEGDASVVGNIGTIVVKGDLKGLSGGSGAIAASSIRKVSVGQILGGIGDDSGQIRAGLLYNVAVKGDVVGGNGEQSGAILTDRAFGAKTGVGAGTVKIGGRLIGGIGVGSGMLSSHGGFVGITVGGYLPAGEEPEITAAIIGGEGKNSGSIQSGGEIRSLKIGGTWKIKEGNAPAVEKFTEVSLQGGFGEGSGSINAGGIRSAQLTGAIVGGEGQVSGKLYSAGAIGTLKVTGFDLPDDDESGNKVSLKGGEGIGSGGILARGSIGKLTLGGEVRGGSVTETGTILAGSIGGLSIDGDLIGGDGDTSGTIQVTGAIRSLTVGEVRGGSASNSGSINAGSIGSARILGDLVGGSASTAGVIQVGGAINSLVVGQVLGGSASATGAIAAGSIGSARILGDLQGSDVSTTGVIKVGGEIKSLFIGGDLKGGNSKAQNEAQSVQATVESGAITAGRIGSLRISGDVTAGEDLGAGLIASGSIGAQGPIGTLEIGGSIIGRQNVPVKIVAFGDTKAAAIGKLLVGGRQGSDRVEYAEITAGVSIYSTPQGYFPVNADAKIGLVRIDGDVKGLNITAGVNTGEDGKFATDDDQVLSHPIVEINNPKVYSSIAQVIINGTIEAVPGESEGETLPFGIVAQYIGKVSYKDGNVLKNVALQKGAGNDKSPGLEIKPGGEDTGFRVIEVPIA